MNIFAALLVVLCVSLGVTVVVTFVWLFNWGVLFGLKTIEYSELRMMSSIYRFIESIEGPLREDHTRPIIGSVCHITFFPCDIKLLGRFASRSR